MATTKRFTSHDEYFADAALEVRPILARIQAIVEGKVPGATRCISYNLPAFRTDRTFFYFAAFRKHIGIYPPVTQDAALIEALAPFRNEKGNLSFPLAEPIPYDLIERVAVALAAERGAK
ncbi:MAG: hypothetical protein IPK07_21330 [Deltaproteobacteria bacterium]|nr:hypothetical protein [Deltaproteobacteria bacterium]